VRAGRSAVRVSARVGAVMLSPGATVDTALAGAEDALGEARRGGGMHVRAPQPSQRGTFLRDG
jgi:hypothetical protein